MTRTPAALVLPIALLLCGCTSWIEFYTAGEAGSGGGGGSGGTGGVPMVCTPGEVRECYSGPAGTKGIGVCQAGEEICAPDGSGFGSCEGETLPDVENCGTPEDDDCDGTTVECGGSLLWARRFGDVDGDYLGGLTMFGDDILVTGHASGAVEFAGVETVPVGAGDAFVARFDGNGVARWVRRFGDTGDPSAASQNGTAIAADTDGNVLVAGTLSGTVDYGGGPLTSEDDGDVFILKLQSDGTHLWSQKFSATAFEFATSVALDPLGGVIVVGSFFGTIDLGAGSLTSEGGNDIYVLKLDANGEQLWAKSFGDASTQKPLAVTTDATGNAIVTGYFGGAVSFGGPTLLAQSETDAFVVKLAGDGSHIWSKALAGIGNQDAWAITADADGSVVLAGSFADSLEVDGATLDGLGPRNAFVLKLGADGSTQWIKGYGDINGTGPVVASAVALNGTSDILLSGSFEGVVDFGTGALPGAGADAFALKLGADGSTIWSVRYGAGDQQYAGAIAADSTGHVLLAGSFSKEIAFESEQLLSAGAADIFLAKLHP